MSELRRRYNMFPNKTFGGHVDTEVLDDGRIRYYINVTGTESTSELIVDPRDENEMRAVSQLHLVTKASDEEGSSPMIDVEDSETLPENVARLIRRLKPTGS